MFQTTKKLSCRNLSGKAFNKILKLVVAGWLFLLMLFCLTPYAAAQGTGGSDLLVLDRGTVTSKMLRYNGSNGAFVDTFATLPSGFRPQRIIIGPDGNIYVQEDALPTGGSYRILRYNAATGDFMGTFATCELLDQRCMANIISDLTFGPDGNLYMARLLLIGGASSIIRFDGATGAFIGVFVPPDSGGLSGLAKLAFGPDGNLYVFSFNSYTASAPHILRYNGSTGAFIDTFIVLDLGQVGVADRIAFGPGGNLYMASEFGLFYYDGRTGAYIGKLIDFRGADPLGIPFFFAPDGNIYRTDRGSIVRYDGSTGARMGTFVATGSGGLSDPIFLVFTGSGSTPQNPDAIFYPQLAVGGGYEVVLLVNNKSDSNWTGTAKPLAEGGVLDYLTTPISLAPRETKKFVLTGGGSIVSAGLEIFGNPGFPTSRISVAYFFNYRENGNLMDSIGIPKGQAARKFTFPVERSSSVNTGMAIRRRANQRSSSISLALFDANGAQTQGASLRSGALFLTEIFANVPAEFLGSVVAESQDEFYLVVLRLETTQTGFQLTSVPADSN